MGYGGYYFDLFHENMFSRGQLSWDGYTSLSPILDEKQQTIRQTIILPLLYMDENTLLLD